MQSVSIVGIGQVPIQKQYPDTLRDLGARVVKMAMADAGVDRVDALFALLRTLAYPNSPAAGSYHL